MGLTVRERCRFGWGQRAVAGAVARGDAVVIGEVLSFSSAIAAARAQRLRVLLAPELSWKGGPPSRAW